MVKYGPIELFQCVNDSRQVLGAFHRSRRCQGALPLVRCLVFLSEELEATCQGVEGIGRELAVNHPLHFVAKLLLSQRSPACDEAAPVRVNTYLAG